MGEQLFGRRVKPGQELVESSPLVAAVSAVLVAANATPRRISIEIQNKSVAFIYLGFDPLVAVTAANGIALDPASGANLGDGGVYQIDLGPEVPVYAIASAGPSRVHVAELVGA